MASSLVKSNRMKRMESKKSHSWWWDSHISPKNSRWLQENLEEMDQNVKKMLKLIEEDADSFAKKAELYFKKRPELVTLVEEFYRVYRSLAERYDHVTGELKKNIPSDLRSQGSGVSDVGSEPYATPYPDTKPARTKSGPRAAGFDFFLGSGGSGSDLNSKEGDESSTLDSESESDDSSVNNYSSTQSNSDEQGSRRRIMELEAELLEMKEKLLHLQQEDTSKGFKKCDHEVSEISSSKLAAYEEELRAVNQNLEVSKEEIARLKIELQKYDSNGFLSNGDSQIQESTTAEIEENMSDDEGGLARRTHRLEHELKTTEKKLRDSEQEVASLRLELTSKGLSIQSLQDQIKSALKEVAVWKNKVEREKREVSRLLDRVVRYKTNLSEREHEIRGLKESIGNANKALAEENEQLQAEMTRLTKERAYLEDNMKEMDLRCQSLDEDVRRAKAAKAEFEITFGAQIEQLKAEIAERDDCVEELNRTLDELNSKIAALGAEISSKDHHLHQLHLQHVELIGSAEEAHKSAEELQSRVKELEIDMERKEEQIIEGAEEKREAIRQLCYSIEHYRSWYYELREAVTAHKQPGVMAT